MIASYKMANVEVSDARVLHMHEVLLAIKLVKFYVWERSFARQVEEVSLHASTPHQSATGAAAALMLTSGFCKSMCWGGCNNSTGMPGVT
jgi:hypothetical protein